MAEPQPPPLDINGLMQLILRQQQQFAERMQAQSAAAVKAMAAAAPWPEAWGPPPASPPDPPSPPGTTDEEIIRQILADPALREKVLALVKAGTPSPAPG